MSLKRLPDFLNAELVGTLSDVIDDGVQRTRMASGAISERRLYRHNPAERSVDMLASDAEANIWLAFANEVAGQPFEMVCELPGFYGAASTARMRFLRFPRPKPAGRGQWLLTLDLFIERIRLPALDELPYPGADAFGDEGQAFADLLETVVNVTLPSIGPL